MAELLVSFSLNLFPDGFSIGKPTEVSWLYMIIMALICIMACCMMSLRFLLILGYAIDFGQRFAQSIAPL